MPLVDLSIPAAARRFCASIVDALLRGLAFGQPRTLRRRRWTSKRSDRHRSEGSIRVAAGNQSVCNGMFPAAARPSAHQRRLAISGGVQSARLAKCNDRFKCLLDEWRSQFVSCQVVAVIVACARQPSLHAFAQLRSRRYHSFLRLDLTMLAW